MSNGLRYLLVIPCALIIDVLIIAVNELIAKEAGFENPWGVYGDALIEGALATFLALIVAYAMAPKKKAAITIAVAIIVNVVVIALASHILSNERTNIDMLPQMVLTAGLTLAVSILLCVLAVKRQRSLTAKVGENPEFLAGKE